MRFKRIIEWFSISKHKVPNYIILDVNTFNTWYCADDNNATYAHKGIFGRLDKLSTSQIEEYFLYCFGITPNKHPFENYEKTLMDFREKIERNWKNKK